MSSEDEISVKSRKPLPPARIFVKLPEKKEVSYKDLIDSFLKENGVSEGTSSSDESESENYSYPAFMQRIMERLDKYGQLALSDQIGVHKSDPRKRRKVEEEDEEDDEKDNHEEKHYENHDQEKEEESENSCEMYYDLSDDFIDDSDLQKNGTNEESEFRKALNEGFFVLSLEEYQKSLPKTPKKPKKPKEKKEKKEIPKVDFQKKLDIDISHLPAEVKEKVEDLKKLYEQKRKEGNTAPFPKGAAPILEKISSFIEALPVDFENMYNNISLMSGQSTENVKIQFSKIRRKLEKNTAQNDYLKLMKAFKRKLNGNEVKWTNQLRNEFFLLLEALRKFVDVANNTSNSRGKKNKPCLNFLEEEAKLIVELKKTGNGKLDNVDFKAEIIELNIPVLPQMSSNFEDPIIKAEDFEPIS